MVCLAWHWSNNRDVVGVWGHIGLQITSPWPSLPLLLLFPLQMFIPRSSLSYVFAITGGVFYASKFPENMFPGIAPLALSCDCHMTTVGAACDCHTTTVGAACDCHTTTVGAACDCHTTTVGATCDCHHC